MLFISIFAFGLLYFLMSMLKFVFFFYRRGLSKFYQGKSQSFTSLTNVKSLEDLAKPESPYNKRLKSCRSYGGFYENKDSCFKSTSAMSRLVSKRGVNSASSRGSCSSLNARKGSGSNFMGSRPPIHPHNRSSTSTNNISNQTALFAWKGLCDVFCLIKFFDIVNLWSCDLRISCSVRLVTN